MHEWPKVLMCIYVIFCRTIDYRGGRGVTAQVGVAMVLTVNPQVCIREMSVILIHIATRLVRSSSFVDVYSL